MLNKNRQRADTTNAASASLLPGGKKGKGGSAFFRIVRPLLHACAFVLLIISAQALGCWLTGV